MQRIVICFLVFAAFLGSQPLPLSTPEKEGLSSERLEMLHQRLDQIVKEGKKAGAITMIVRNGRIADWKTYGYRDIARAAHGKGYDLPDLVDDQGDHERRRHDARGGRQTEAA